MEKRKAYNALYFMMFFLTSIIHGPSFAWAQQPSEISVAPLNPDFLNYFDTLKIRPLQQPSNEHGPGLIPSPVDLSHLQGTLLFQEPVTLSFLSTYDLRTSGKLTPIRDQGMCENRWTFGTYGSLEFNPSPSESSDFSENNLKNTHGFDWGLCDGGNAFMSTAYLARWDGPINESDDPYNPFSLRLPTATVDCLMNQFRVSSWEDKSMG